ncbi:MAG: hypothetical protein AAFU69_09510, partial [Pseudomonadota bacterium]
EHALRLAAAGALLADDLGLQLVKELRTPAARAVYETRTDAVLKGHSARVFVSAFSPDGRRIVTASEDKTARGDCERNPHIGVILGYDSAHDETTL